MTQQPEASFLTGTEIAVIGMAARFPGSRNVQEYWANLAGGVEGIRFFTDDELRAAGIDEATLADPAYVKARAVLDDIDRFDAEFFGLSPREAECTDPQHRVFLEVSHEALEHAGCDPARFDGLIGVYGGVSRSMYLLRNLSSHPEIIARMGGMQIGIGNDKDFVTTRVSYKLGLRGPSVNVQSACSTSLVAVHLACQGLLNRECDVALAGGATIGLPQTEGYVYMEGGVASPDGHCRAFDAQAAGCIGGNGAGAVVLRRLEDALESGDQVFAVLKGSAVNNDGADKMAYTAPSIRGQTEVIAEAQAVADIEPETVSFIEAHGTGTAIGDPIEVRALTQVFREATERQQFCALGSVKTNIGHTDSAAGVAGLLKAVLAMHHGQIPPTLHFQSGNPECDLENSPFYVNADLREWTVEKGPRRAGVSSFGIGGTNAHVVLEEAPSSPASTSTSRPQVLPLSARTPEALQQAAASLSDHLAQTPDLSLADAAHTLQTGRQGHEQRAVVIATDTADAIEGLRSADPHRRRTGQRAGKTPSVAFLFPGQGSQHVHMGRDLDRTEPAYREALDRCVRTLEPLLGQDLRQVLDPPEGAEDSASQKLRGTGLTQPALFAVEYSLACQWMQWGVRPEAMIGHSIGEYVAATLSGVFSLEDALRLVAARSRLMASLPAGSMVAVVRPAAEVEPLLEGDLCLAAANEPSSCVVSGPTEQVEAWAEKLKQEGIAVRPLHTSHAFHSSMMDPILDEFTEQVASVKRRPPEIPFLSNLTGTWITEEEATDPEYWARHLRQAVRFSDGVTRLVDAGPSVLLEVGPGRTLSTLAGRVLATLPDAKQHTAVVSSLRHPSQPGRDDVSIRTALGDLWLHGVDPDWDAVHHGEHRRRVSLPTYPFQRTRHWVDAGAPTKPAAAKAPAGDQKNPLDEWLHVPSWQQSPRPVGVIDIDEPWLVLADQSGVGLALVNGLRRQGARVLCATAADDFSRKSGDDFGVPATDQGLGHLFEEMSSRDLCPRHVVHLWSLDGAREDLAVARGGFRGTLQLLQRLQAARNGNAMDVTLVTRDAQDVTGGEDLDAGLALLTGLARVLPQECPGVRTHLVDLDTASVQRPEQVAGALAHETVAGAAPQVAFRGPHRFVLDHARMPAGATDGRPRLLRENGVYLITGGLGQVGQVIGAALASDGPVRLILAGRTGLPARDRWDEALADPTTEQRDAQRIRDLMLLEQRGAQVSVIAADVADAARMTTVVQGILQEHGALNGVIHAAGVIDGASFCALEELNESRCQEQFHAKVDGLVALDRALAGSNATPDFCLLVSSLSSVLGGLGMAAYASANAFVDGFAQRRSRAGGTIWRAVDLDAFRFGEDDAGGESRTALAQLAMTADEGVQVLRRVLGLVHAPQVVVSTGDLPTRWGRWVRMDAPAARTGVTSRSSPQRGGESRDADRVADPGTSETTAPTAAAGDTSGEIETALADIWSEVLGVPEVGPYDNFLDLGGHSLLMVQVSAEIQKRFGVRVNPGENLFLTLGQLAALVEERLAAGPDTAEPETGASSEPDATATGLRGKLGRLLRKSNPGEDRK